MCYHCSTGTQTFYTFILRLSVWTLPWLVGESNPPNVSFLMSIMVGYLPIITYFNKMYSNTLGIFLRRILRCVSSGQYLEGSAFEGHLEDQCLQYYRMWFRNCQQFFLIIPVQAGFFIQSNLLGGLHSCHWVPDIYFSVWRFLEEVPKLSAKNWLSLHKLYLFVPSDILGVSPLLLPDFLIIWLFLLWSYFCDLLLVPQFPVLTGDLILLEWLLCSFPGNLLPAFFFSLLVMEKVLTGFHPSIKEKHSVLSVFLYVIWGRRV